MNAENKLDPRSIVEKLAAEERKFSERTFIAPLVGDGCVRVRMSGILYEMQVSDQYKGWALLRMAEPRKARVIEAAAPALVSKYLSLFPRVRLILVRIFERVWWALPASTSDTRLQLSGPVPIHLVNNAAAFDTVYGRFDGSVFWFETVDRRRDPKIAKTLQRSLEAGISPEDLSCHSAVLQEKLAYRMLWIAEHEEEKIELTDAERFASAVGHAGAQFEGFHYQSGGDSATVKFTLNNTLRSVVVRTGDLTVQSAGICLDGQDQDFDLSSLVGVLRQADDDYGY